LEPGLLFWKTRARPALHVRQETARNPAGAGDKLGLVFLNGASKRRVVDKMGKVADRSGKPVDRMAKVADRSTKVVDRIAKVVDSRKPPCRPRHQYPPHPNQLQQEDSYL
jgi:hypothetical protein